MRWRAAVNAGLSRTTGYRLVKAGRPQSGHGPGRRKPPAGYYDAEARETIRAVRPRTMTGNQKLFALIVATRHVADHGIPGAVVECGVWRGGSMQAIARTLMARGVRDRDLHLYDTFEGMPPPAEQDVRHDGAAAADLLGATPTSSWVWAIADLDDVRQAMAESGYPERRVHFHPGLVEETIPDEAPEQIALLRLDTDWYASTRHELEHLYDRVPSGGVIIFDDYDFWDGARQAVDEFLGRRDERLLLVPAASGRIAVKP